MPMLNDLLRFVPPERHRDYLCLLAQIPGYVRRIAVVGEPCAAIGHILKKRPGVGATGVTDDPKAAALAGAILDGVVRSEAEAEALPPGAFDALVLCNLECRLDGALRWLRALAHSLAPFGHVYALHGDPARAPEVPAGSFGALAAHLSTALEAAGYPIYRTWPLGEAPDGHLAMAVRPGYNPVRHAQSVAGTGDFENAFGILEGIPAIYLEVPETREAVGLLKLEFLAGQMEQCGGGDLSQLLGRAQDVHYALTDQFPRNPGSYRAMARCWQGAGDPGMARRILASIHFAVPDPAIAAERDRIAAQGDGGSHSVVAPDWNPPPRFRVLILIHPRPHFGLDALFDGLCTCLGEENVVDFPWKPTLHGQTGDTLRDYPCRFHRGGTARSAAEIVAELEAGAFDAILYGDVEGDLPPDFVQAIMAARGACPVYLVDELDQPGNFRELARQRIGLADDFAACFKREMVACLDYGPHTYPLPFAYTRPDNPPAPPESRTRDFFWAGHRMFGQRRLYLETLEARYAWDLDVRFDQDTYRAKMQASRIGLNCFGMGFDTVRYWELPAHGCMLLSERLPIRVPFNFVDGVSAVFFDDLADLVEKLDYYLAHPEQTATIAAAGHACYLASHTNEARARQMLGWMMAIR